MTGSLDARYGSREFARHNNSDRHAIAYQGVSKYFITDVRLRWKISQARSAAASIDKLNKHKYWNFHPNPQRTYSAEVRFDP